MKNTIILILFLLTAAIVYGQNENSTTVTAPASDVVRKFLSAYQRGDHETFANLLHPDVIWIQPGENKIAGVKKSKAELMQMGAAMSKWTERTLRLVDVNYFSANGNTVSCILTWKASRPGGETLDVKNIDVYTVENGKIVLAKIFSEDIAAEDLFWGK